MFPRTHNRKAISTVLTTLIILVASVVLGTGVVLYGTSLFQTGSQSESITATGVKVWADAGNSGWAWGAADVRNSGDKLLSLDTISVRGTSVPFTSWYANSSSTAITTTIFQQSLNYTTILNTANGAMKNGTAVGIPASFANGQCGKANQLSLMLGSTSQNQNICLSQQSGPISLQPGAKVIVYFKVPQNVLTSVDAGSAGSVAIYAGKVGAPQTVTVASQ
jgi:hypothetical protein